MAGKPLGQVFQERIFDPLKMHDTGFFVREDQRSRFAACYNATPQGGLKLQDDPQTSPYLAPPALESGGGGLVSTAADYMRFANMLVNEGELDGATVTTLRGGMDVVAEALREELQAAMDDDPPRAPADILSLVKARKAEQGLPDAEVVRVIWGCLMRSVAMTGKNQGQILQGILRAAKTHRKLLAAFVTNGRLELTLLVAVQVSCYEDNRLLKLFVDVVKALYTMDLVGEDAVQHWYKKGSHPKGRNVFLKDMEPFIKWLDEASEEEGDGEEGDE